MSVRNAAHMDAVVLCRPVDWSETGWPQELLDHVNEAFRQDHPELAAQGSDPFTGMYAGSVVRPCASCGIRCWVGPRSIKQVEAGALVGCYRCVIESQGTAALDNMVSLDNPDAPRRPR